MMDDRGKSDGPVVPTKLPNNAPGGAAEVVEGRGPAEGNAARETRAGLRAGVGVSSDLDRVRRVARKDKDARFTALLHHVDVDRLRAINVEIIVPFGIAALNRMMHQVARNHGVLALR